MPYENGKMEIIRFTDTDAFADLNVSEEGSGDSGDFGDLFGRNGITGKDS